MTYHPLRRRPFLAAIAGLAAAGSAEVGDAGRLPRIGIIGAGNVGTTLGGFLVQAGYHVMLSARALSEARSVATSLGPLASAGTPAQAVAFGDIVVLAVPYGAIPELGQTFNRALTGKIVLDPANPYPSRDGPVAETALSAGAGITTQRYFPSASVVRAFNSIDMSSLRAATHRMVPLLAVPVAGDDRAAVTQVETLVEAAGFAPVVTGGLASARLFQPGSRGFELKRDADGLKRELCSGY